MADTAAALKTPTDIQSNEAKTVAQALNGILADTFALYLKTKNFHWHVSGPHFHDYHLMFDAQAEQIFATTDAIAERVRKTGNTTLRSIGDIARHQSIKDSDAAFVKPEDMLNMIKTGGIAAKQLNDTSFFFGLLHTMQEMGGHRTGTGLATAYQNWAAGRSTQQAAEELAQLGLLNKDSVKYGKTGLLVRTWQDDARAHVAICDRGSGIGVAELERLREPFSRGSNAQGEGGTGLGLAIVDRIARLHGGALTFHAREGGGLAVVVSLPA